jgi:NADPH:quinone reductase-like Zn-dependent oxidoreductase
MKTVRFHEYGDANVLRYEDAVQPSPGPGEVLIRVAATSFNPVDAGIRGGYLREAFQVSLPHVPGIDVAGTVVAVGPDVSKRAPGDRVAGFLPMDADGAAAEYVVAPAAALTGVPEGVPLTDAAAVPEVGLTAWQALSEYAELRPGQRLLVNGAGGAVGAYAIQLAKRAGAHVIATASPRSFARVQRLGADEIIDHTATEITDVVAEPVDVVLNLARIDRERLTALGQLLRAGGVLVNTVPTITPDEVPGTRALTLFVRSDAIQLGQLLALIDSGELHVEIAERLPLSELPAVHARSDAGELSGKVVLVVEAS